MKKHSFSSIVISVAAGLSILALSGKVTAQDTDAEALRHFKTAQQAQAEGNFDLAAQEYLKVIRILPRVGEAYASLGMVYNAEGKFSESAHALEMAKKLKPELPGVSLYLGIDDIKCNQPAQAIPYLREAVRLEPKNEQAWLWLDTALWGAGQTVASLEELDKISLLFPSDAVILLRVGEAYRKAADQGIERTLAIAEGTPFFHQVYGDIYKDERDWQKASGHYHRAIDLNPRWAGAHLGLGEVALRQEKLDDAEQEFRKELQINPRCAEAQAQLAEIALLQGKPDDALGLLSSAIQTAPDEAANALGLPHSYMTTGESFSEQAVERLRQSLPALEGSSTSPSRNLALAFVNSRLGVEDIFNLHWSEFQKGIRRPTSTNSYEQGISDFDRQDFHAAETDLHTWLASHPHDALAAYLLARTYRNISLSVLAHLLAEYPGSYPAHQLLAETYENEDEDDKAIAEYREVEKLEPDLEGIHFSVGNLLFNTGHFDQAMVELEAELRLNPNHAGANAEMGSILARQLEPAKAILYLRKAIQLDPDLSMAHRELGKTYYMQKDFAKAEAELLKAIADDPDGSAHYQLGLVYRAQGHFDDANKMFALTRQIKAERLSRDEVAFTARRTSYP